MYVCNKQKLRAKQMFIRIQQNAEDFPKEIISSEKLIETNDVLGGLTLTCAPGGYVSSPGSPGA